VKKTLSHFAVPGMEYSLDEATMACFSRYARKLISFNPVKPTGKFHFKFYMHCCAYTNSVLKIRIHTRDGSDNDGNPEVEEGMISTLDLLVLGMCSSLYRIFSTVNIENYYMSTTCAANLRKNGVLCQGTIRSSRKFVKFRNQNCKMWHPTNGQST
jgi:hypothetical protein